MAMPSQVCSGGFVRERGRLWFDDSGFPGGGSGKPLRQYRDEPCESIVIVIKGTAYLTATP